MMARGGFTLIELVVVLLIVAVATAVTVPALLSEPVETELDAATHRIQDLFRIARDSAVRAGVPVTVTIDSATGAVWLGSETVDGGAVRAGGPLELPPGVGLQLSEARATFSFSPGGAAFADSLLLRAGTEERLITIDTWTGHMVAY
ncbi:MAG: GspH/FimT family protein [Gemmatimonadota bacterium]